MCGRARASVDARGRPIAVATIEARYGWRFNAIARGPAASDLLKTPTDGDIIAVKGNAVRSNRAWWVLVAGVSHGEPPEPPWLGVFSRDQAEDWPCWVARCDAPDEPLVVCMRYATYESALRLANVLMARCIEYPLPIVDFTHGGTPARPSERRDEGAWRGERR